MSLAKHDLQMSLQLTVKGNPSKCFFIVIILFICCPGSTGINIMYSFSFFVILHL